MKIENQVCSLEQAKKLDELGVKYKDYQYAYVDFTTASGQEAVLCRPASHVEERQREWAWFMVGSHSEEITAEIDEDTVSADGGIYPAFTVAELGVMLPLNCDSIKDQTASKVIFWACNEGLTGDCNEVNGANEAEARAAMLIYLLENNLTTPEEVNTRLNKQ